MPRRWDTDERGRGVASAAALLHGARELLEAMRLPDWVAEDPEAHLMPHVRAALERQDAPFVLEWARTADDGALIISVRWSGRLNDRRGQRSAAHALIAEFAESATYVRQRRQREQLRYEVVTGMLAGDSEFAPHGHVVRVIISGVE